MSVYRTLLSNGCLVDPFDLKAKDLNPEVIAHSLANINRYSGNTLVPYSVAQHSVILSFFVDKGLEKAAMLHDVPEMVLGDIPYPVKCALGDVYEELENKVLKAVFDAFHVPTSLMLDIEDLDRRICINEMRDLCIPHPDLGHSDENAIPGLKIIPMNWIDAKSAYINRFHQVFYAH